MIICLNICMPAIKFFSQGSLISRKLNLKLGNFKTSHYLRNFSQITMTRVSSFSANLGGLLAILEILATPRCWIIGKVLSEIRKYLKKEIDCKAVLGPFQKNPFNRPCFFQSIEHQGQERLHGEKNYLELF